MPAQPFSQEALEWLRGQLLGKTVLVRIYARDRYDRVVCRNDKAIQQLAFFFFARVKKRGIELTEDFGWGSYQVSMAWYPRALPFLPMKNVSAEMLKVGYGQIYRQAGSQYGGMLNKFEALEAKARYVPGVEYI
jgi:hypothetical protein